MTRLDTDTLRRTFSERTEQAPQGLGMLETVLAAAPARRKRRRRIQAIGLAVAVTAAAIVTPLLLDDASEPPSPSDGPRTPLTVTATVAPESGYESRYRELYGGVERLGIEQRGVGSDRAAGWVWVFPPGTFDPQPYRTGEPVDVNGRPGYFVPRAEYAHDRSLPFPGTPMPPSTGFDTRVAWQAPDGRWLLYRSHGEQSREVALGAARSVTLSEPQDARGPVALPDAPGDLPIQGVGLRDEGGLTLEVSYGTTPVTAKDDPAWTSTTRASLSGFTLTVFPHKGLRDPMPVDEPPYRIGEIEAWYTESPTYPYVRRLPNATLPNAVAQPNAAALVVVAGTCVAIVAIDDTRQTPRAAAEAFVADIDFRDCDDPSTWGPLLR